MRAAAARPGEGRLLQRLRPPQAGTPLAPPVELRVS
jgi:hypothetical protein